MLHKRIVLGETVLIAAEYSMIQTRNTTADTKRPQFPFQLSRDIQPWPNGDYKSHICETLDKCLVEVNRLWGHMSTDTWPLWNLGAPQVRNKS